MLLVHCVHLLYNLRDLGMKNLLYEVESVRHFASLWLSGALPDETTILNFRRLLETYDLGEALFEEINAHLASQGRRLQAGTIMNASIIEALVDEEPSGRAQLGDAEGQAVAFRYEDAHRHGRGIESYAQIKDDASECGESDGGGRAAARRRGAGVGDAGYQGAGKREASVRPRLSRDRRRCPSRARGGSLAPPFPV